MIATLAAPALLPSLLPLLPCLQALSPVMIAASLPVLPCLPFCLVSHPPIPAWSLPVDFGGPKGSGLGCPLPRPLSLLSNRCPFSTLLSLPLLPCLPPLSPTLVSLHDRCRCSSRSLRCPCCLACLLTLASFTAFAAPAALSAFAALSLQGTSNMPLERLQGRLQNTKAPANFAPKLQKKFNNYLTRLLKRYKN